jgi:serine/threonine-protein kinase
VGALVIGSAGVMQRREASLCKHAGARLAGVWDAPRRAKLEEAFVKSGLPHAREMWQRASAVVDGYTQRWIATHEEACRATHVDGRQSEALLDLRMTCLDRRRATVSALTDLWQGTLTPKLVDGAARAAASLPPLDDCSDPSALTSPLPLPRDPDAQKRIKAVRDRLDRLKAELANSWSDGFKAATDLRRAADATGYVPLQAEAMLQLAMAAYLVSDGAALAHADEAARLGALAHDDRLAAEALILSVKVLSNNGARFDEALERSRAAEAFVARAGDPPRLRGLLLAARGRALVDGGKSKEAREVLDVAVQLLEATLGPNALDTFRARYLAAGTVVTLGDYASAREQHLQLLALAHAIGVGGANEAAILTNLGTIEEHTGNRAAARGYHEQALALYRQLAGPQSLEAVIATVNVANVDLLDGRLDDAAKGYLAAKEILVHLGGEGYAYIAVALSDLGGVRRAQGRLDEAEALGAQALALADKTYGKESEKYIDFEDEYARTLAARGDYTAARAHAEHAVAVLRKVSGPDAAPTLEVRSHLAEIDARHGRCVAAAPELHAIAKAQEAQAGPGRPLAFTLQAIAACALLAGEAAEAARVYQRATAMLETAGPPAELGSARFELARAQWAAGDARAVATARQAELELRRGEGTAGAQRAVHVWLAAHAR